MKVTLFGDGWNSPGQNRGATWTINRACRVRGYDMEGVVVDVPPGYRLDRFSDGFDVISPFGRFADWVLDLTPLHVIAAIAFLYWVIRLGVS